MKSKIILLVALFGLTVSAQEKRLALIDRFNVPKASIAAFAERMEINRRFIKTLPGFVRDNVYEQVQENGDLVVVTVAVWENQQAIDKAKEKVQAEYKRIGFDMPKFIAGSGIALERGIFAVKE